ncbi:MAG: T9SS type A sorting domain-containing protein [Clostridiales bacterium]|nr:T9SS type A sorting domain-containing protein [Clostridiales bacterium]MBN2761808.1 T9SS type A sorting domain-containing protein [Bacteroidales bacterium]
MCAETENNNECILYQNVPNPFHESTKIEYYLNDDVQKAYIYIYDMNGTQIKSLPVNIKGYGHVILYGNELKAGMYMYSLITDGEFVSTRQMILTD